MGRGPGRSGPAAGGSQADPALAQRRLARELMELATVGAPRFDFLREAAARARAATGAQVAGFVVRGARRWYVGRLGRSWRLVTVAGPNGWGEFREILRRAGVWRSSEVAGIGAALDRAGERFWHGFEALTEVTGEGAALELAAVTQVGDPQAVLVLGWRGEAPRRGGGAGLAVARPLAGALAYHRAQAALRERVKELTCLYNLARATERVDAGVDELLAETAALLPPAWQYPEITAAAVELDGRSCRKGPIEDAVALQEAPILVQGVARGRVVVGYLEERPELDEGPFLEEERKLIEAVAREVGLAVERIQAREERRLLEEQLRHADRLATIGQLAAGVAHELNEPLAAILGFAQLVAGDASVPEGVRTDVERIVRAALHAREVIKKLMFFARQTPPRTEPVDLNRLVEEGLYVLEARCAKQGIEVRKELDTSLPSIAADPGQLQQVLVNLAVNAVQAMPEGGRMTIRTRRAGEAVRLEVEDTGVGMTEEVRQKIFLPFFTTKDVDQGTGLGLAVVHGIVTAHGGTVEVDSEPGRGSRFAVELPAAGARGPRGGGDG